MASTLLIAAAAHLAFSVEAVKTTYLVGEPVVVTVTEHGRGRVHDEGWFGLGRPSARFRVLIDRGAGFQRFQRKVLTSPLTEPTRPRDVVDGQRQELVLSYDAAIEDVVFPVPGQVCLAIEYEDASVRVRSNVVVLEIVAPEGDERSAYQAIRALPHSGIQFFADLVDPGGRVLSDDASQQIVAAFPTSVYVQGARLCDHVYDADATSSAAAALAADLRGGQFEPAALVTLGHVQDAAGLGTAARLIWHHVIHAFPGRVAADEARAALLAQAEDDDEAASPR